MGITGTMNVSRPAGYECGQGAVALVSLYGPRGGHVGDALIDRVDARRAISRLGNFAGISRMISVVTGHNDDGTYWVLACESADDAKSLAAADPDARSVITTKIMSHAEAVAELRKLAGEEEDE